MTAWGTILPPDPAPDPPTVTEFDVIEVGITWDALPTQTPPNPPLADDYRISFSASIVNPRPTLGQLWPRGSNA